MTACLPRWAAPYALARTRTVREVVDCSGSATCRAFVHTLPNGSSYVASTWLISYPPHSSHFGNTCLVFVNFLPFSNRRFPYLGLVGIFAAQIIHSGFLFQFVRQVTSVGIPYTRHSQGPLPQEGMCHDVTTTLFFCPHLATSCFALRESSSCLSFRHFPLTETASSCTPQLPTPTTVQ
jgi:hypothetical protein